MDFVGNRRVASSAALERKLRQDIYSCTLREGDLLASENQLIRKYKLSGYQIRKAVANLKKEGLLRSVRGSGTYVVSPEDRRKSAHSAGESAGRILFLSFESYFSRDLFHSPGTYDPIFRGLSHEFASSRYDLVFGHVNDETSAPECLASREIAGVIFLGEPTPEFYRKHLRRFPCVGINNYQISCEFDRVRLDDLARSYIAAEYLASIGHRRIAYFCDSIGSTQTDSRVDGFRKAVRELGLDPDPELEIVFRRIPQGESDAPWSAFPDFSSRLKPLFTSANPPTAIICYDDPRLVAIQFSLQKLGLSVPGDVSLTGAFNGRQTWCENATSVCDRMEDICVEAARLLLENIEREKTAAGKTVLLQPYLVRGQTTSPLKIREKK